MGDVLAVAGSVDVDPKRVHRETVEDRGGERGVAEVLAPLAERDVGCHGRRSPTMPSVDQVVECVCGGGLVALLLHLTEAYVVDDQEFGRRPRLEPAWIGPIGEAGVEVVEEIDATGVTQADALLAGTHAECLEKVALAGAGITGDDDVVVAPDEVEARELEDDRLVELGLEVEVEGLERLVLLEPAAIDAACDALLQLVGGLDTEDVLEQRRRTGTLAYGPRESLVELLKSTGQPEEFEVSSESLESGVVAGGVAGFSVSLGHKPSWTGSGVGAGW